MSVGFTKVDHAFTEPQRYGLLFPRQECVVLTLAAEPRTAGPAAWAAVGAGGGFLQTPSGGPHSKKTQSYYLRSFGEGEEFPRDGRHGVRVNEAVH